MIEVKAKFACTAWIPAGDFAVEVKRGVVEGFAAKWALVNSRHRAKLTQACGAAKAAQPRHHEIKEVVRVAVQCALGPVLSAARAADAGAQAALVTTGDGGCLALAFAFTSRHEGVFLHLGLRQTLQSAHQGLQATTPPHTPSDMQCIITSHHLKQKVRHRRIPETPWWLGRKLGTAYRDGSA